MALKFSGLLGAVVLAALTSPCRADVVDIGSLVFANPLSTLQGFEVIDETGPLDGCDAPDGIPVCTVLTFQNTSLTVTLSDNSTLTSTPSGGFSFAPGAYIYGANAGDDPSQSFLFNIDPSLSIVSATFTGVISQGAFQITDGTNESTVISDGAFSAMLDLSSNPTLAAQNITVNTQTANALPEPGGMGVVVGGLLAALSWMRFGKSRDRRTPSRASLL